MTNRKGVVVYEVFRDKNTGKLIVKRLADGLLLSHNNPEFLAWNKQQAHPLNTEEFEFPAGHFQFRELSSLVEYCRENGVTLYVQRFPNGGVNFEFGGDHHFHDRGKLCNVSEAGASSDAANDGIEPRPSKIWVDPNLARLMRKEISTRNRVDDLDGNNLLRRVSALPIERTFAYLDISDFSKNAAGRQALIVNSLVRAVNTEEWWMGQEFPNVFQAFEAMLCIGDGYIFVFEDALIGTYFAAYLAGLLETLVAKKQLPVDFHFRMGVHEGPVYTFWDPGRKDWNYIGDGINGGSRVLAAVGKESDDVMYVSGQVRESIMARQMGTDPTYSKLLECMLNRGRKNDKHGHPWRVYEVSHTTLVMKSLPSELLCLFRGE